MPSFHRIEELPTLAGHIVTTRGWVMTTRSSGKIGFVMLRDGTGYLQVVLSKKDVPEAAWEAFGGLTQETSVEVTGTVRADARAPGGVELTAARASARDRKSTRLNSSHLVISYAVFCLKKKKE